MRNVKHIIVSMVLAFATQTVANAQFYELANQIPQLISPALSGSFAYKGYVGVSYIKGLGDCNADFLDLSTTQGFQYSSWFFMGVGAGVDVVFSHTSGGWRYPSDGFGWSDNNPGKGYSSTGVMLPLFSDFRFNIGGVGGGPSFFADIRIGASFLVSDDYLSIGDGFLTSDECFYFRPTLGIRIPISKNTYKQAFNIGVSYQLVTSEYWNIYSDNTTLNGLGVSASFEW